MDCLDITGLTHRYATDVVLDGIDLHVPEGAVYGFLGPNGAGKTTTLRLILGLLTTQQGRITVFGRHLDTHRIAILAKVGSMIESPSSYDHLSASENLEVLRRVHRCPATRIAEVLDLVGLSTAGRKKVRQFSLGMKQRLAIAAALLHSPRLLVLDEPTNGLDADGMIEIRRLLTRLNQVDGITILVSSHLLAEIEKLVTHVGVIAGGRMAFEGTLEQLKARAQPASSVRLRTDDDTTSLGILASVGIAARLDGGQIVLPALSQSAIAAANRHLVDRGVGVHDIGVVNGDLESIYMNLVSARA